MGVFPAPKESSLWDVEGGVGVSCWILSFERTRSGEGGIRPVAANPLLIFDEDRAC